MAVRRLAALCGLSVLAAAETAVPPIWPQLQGIFPAGARRGTEIKVTLKVVISRSRNAVVFGSGKLKGRVTKATPYQVEALVSVAADAEPGRHDLRLLAPHGSTIGYFDVGVLREQTENEPNETAAQAELLTLPVVVNGIIRQADYDYFKFEAKAGQTMVFDVLATRNGANTDGVLSILDEAGEELAYTDDYHAFKDPHLVYRFAKKCGVYFEKQYLSNIGRPIKIAEGRPLDFLG